jgi:hypothetical protein
MRSAEDIADALNKTALKLAYTGECKTFGSVIDTNGNNVGGWEIQ